MKGLIVPLLSLAFASPVYGQTSVYSHSFNGTTCTSVIGSVSGSTFCRDDGESHKNALYKKIRELGNEYGATTGRPRQVNWLDFDMLKRATRINGVNKLVFNKMDIMEEVNKWCLYYGPSLYEFSGRDDAEFWLSSKLLLEVDENIEVFFSGDVENI